MPIHRISGLHGHRAVLVLEKPVILFRCRNPLCKILEHELVGNAIPAERNFPCLGDYEEDNKKASGPGRFG